MTHFHIQPTNAELGDVIINENQRLEAHIDAIHQHLDVALKNIRPKMTNWFITCKDDGNIFFTMQFDNFTAKNLPVFSTFYGPCDVYCMKFSEFYCEEKMFMINFPDYNRTVVGTVRKANKTYLYDCFIKKGFHFNPLINRTKLQNSLFEYFARSIFYPQNIIEFPGLAGWDKNLNFKHSADVPSSDVMSFLPIAKKGFCILPYESQTFSIYRKKYLKFKDVATRYIMMSYPFISLLSSIFAKEGRKFNFTINFVPIEEIDLTEICDFFQIFNRDLPCFIDQNLTHKMLEDFLQRTKDEVLIMDLRQPGAADYYRRNVSQRNFEFVTAVLSGQKKLQNQIRPKITAGLVTITNNLILRQNVFNIIWDSEMTCPQEEAHYNIDLFKEHQTLERVLSQFVTFTEKNKTDVFFIMTRKRTSSTANGIILEIIDEILGRFWNNLGIDFHNELNFPEKINFDAFFSHAEDRDDDDEIQIFIDIIRKAASCYRIIPKNSPKKNHNTIFYNQHFVWFPASVMKEIGEKNGLRDYRRLFLKLRELGFLVAESDRLIQRVHMNHVTFNAYKFHREFFTRPGEIDFIHLGEKDEKC